MNIRDFLITLQEEQLPKQDDSAQPEQADQEATEAPSEGSTPASQTLQPSGAPTDDGQAPAVDQDAVQADATPVAQEVPADGEPQQADTDNDQDDTKKRPSQEEYHSQTDLPEESITESWKKVGEYESGNHKATIHKMDGEFKVKFHKDGVHHEPSDYFTDDKEDAFGTAKHQTDKTASKSIKESMTPEQKAKREEIVTAMKANKKDFETRYGDKAKEVVYATATKQAVNEELSFTEAFENALSEGTTFAASLDGVRGLMEAQGLEEEFAEKATKVFEEAVNGVIKEHVAKVSKYAAYVMESMLEEKLTEMESELDSRLNEAVAIWHADNQIGIEQGVRVQVAESMMDKLATVLKEHFVEVPDYKKDLYEENLQVVSVQGVQLKESKEEATRLSEEVATLKKELFIESKLQGLTMLQRERLKELSEGLRYESEDDFAKKFEILQESIVDKKSVKDSQAILEDSVVIEHVEVQPVRGDSYINSIASTIGKYTKH